MDHSFANDDDDFYRSGREPREIYAPNGWCFGFDEHKGACERELDPGQELCARCSSIVQALDDEAFEAKQRDERIRAGIFTEGEKEEIREELTAPERFEFDQECAMSEYIHALKAALRSQSIFGLAELKYGQDALLVVPQLAAEVQLWRDGRFQTVYDVIEACAAHHMRRRDYCTISSVETHPISRVGDHLIS